MSERSEGAVVVRAIASIAVGIFAVICLFASCSTISPGNVGVVFNKVTGSLRTEPQGMVWKLPFLTSVQSYPVSLRTYTMVQRGKEGSSDDDDAIDLPTKESQHIKQDLSVTYNTSPDRAAEVFKSFRGEDIQDIEKTFIRRTIITVAQNVSGSMPLQDVTSTKRDELQAQIEEKLRIQLTKMGFNLDKVNLGAAHLPPVIEQQLQQKMAAQQEAEQAQFELIKQETLAKAAAAKAAGEKASNELVRQSLTPELLQMAWINKWNGVLPLYSAGAGATPAVMLPAMK